MECASQEKPIYHIYCKAAPNLFVTVTNCKVVLAPASVNDKFQQWHKVERSAEGSFFSLINKATGHAIKHPVVNGPVELIYSSNNNDESILWSECDVSDGNGYKSITMVNNTKLCWDVHGGDVKDGARVGVDYWLGKDIERWIIAPCAPSPLMRSPVRISCKAAHNYSVSVRDNRVVLASANQYDKFQEWYKVEGITQVNSSKNSCFVLVNSVTGQAIKHPAANRPVELVPYSGNIDDTILWTEWDAVDGDSYKSIRMVNNTYLCWNVHGGNVKDGAPVGVDYWFGKEIERWIIASWAPPPPTCGCP